MNNTPLGKVTRGVVVRVLERVPVSPDQRGVPKHAKFLRIVPPLGCLSGTGSRTNSGGGHSGWTSTATAYSGGRTKSSGDKSLDRLEKQREELLLRRQRLMEMQEERTRAVNRLSGNTKESRSSNSSSSTIDANTECWILSENENERFVAPMYVSKFEKLNNEM